MARILDLHVHTSKGSSDSALSPDQLVVEAHRLGLHGVALTEHGGPWDSHEFLRFARQHDLLLIRAMELETDMGHIIAFGLDGRPPGVGAARELRKALDQAGGYAILAHPFRGLYNPPPYNRPELYRGAPSVPTEVAEAASHPVFGLVDAVEVANGATPEEENRFALRVARYLGLQGTGGSDAHSFQGLGRYVTVFEDDVRDQEEVLEALTAGRFYPARLLSSGQVEPLAEDQPFPGTLR